MCRAAQPDARPLPLAAQQIADGAPAWRPGRVPGQRGEPTLAVPPPAAQEGGVDLAAILEEEGFYVRERRMSAPIRQGRAGWGWGGRRRGRVRPRAQAAAQAGLRLCVG